MTRKCLKHLINKGKKNDENHETDQIQAKGPSGEERRPKWRRTNHKKKVMNLKWMSLFTYKGINNYLVIF